MKRVIGTACLSLSFLVGPALAQHVGLGRFAATAWAQQPADAVTEVARQRYREGVKAFEAGKFEDARAAFLQAYALKRVPAVLLNLGQSELRTAPPRYEEAGNHLQQFLREHTAATPEERAAAEKGITEVRKHTGTVTVTVDTAGADIAIDAAVVGKSPLADPVFVKPGKHVLTASSGGKTANDTWDAQVGIPKAITLSIGAAQPPVPVPGPVPPMAPNPPMPGLGTNPPPELPPMNPGPTPPPDNTSGLTFSQWYAKKPVAWVFTGVAGVGFLTGFIFTIVSGAASGTTNSAADAIRTHLKAGQTAPCARDGSGQLDANGFGSACQTLRDDISTFHTDVGVAATGWVFFGLGGIATLTYAMIDWYPHRKGAPSTSSSSTGSIRVIPIVTRETQGLSVTGSF